MNNIRNDLLQVLYLKIWMFTLMQVESNNQGAYIWLVNTKDKASMLHCHIDEELIKEEINHINEEELQEIKTVLEDDGFEITKTENNNILITITRENLYKPAKKSTRK